MKRNKVQSDNERLKLLTNLVAHPEITNPNGEPLFDPDTITGFQTLIDTFTNAVTARKQSIFARRDRRIQLERSLTELKTDIRIIWRTIHGRVHTGKAPPTCFVLYGLDGQGKQPANIRNRGWMTLGEQILSGDLIAEASGSPSLGEAGRASLHRAITGVQDAIESLERDSTSENKAVRQLAIIREKVDSEIRKVTLRIDLAFTDHTKLTKRKTMRVLGFSFQGDPEVPTESEVTETHQTV